MGARLERLRAYREIVDRLLTLAAERSFDGGPRRQFDDLFRDLVKTVAWQESCWRQFVRTGRGRRSSPPRGTSA
jgi:hypothetical protein